MSNELKTAESQEPTLVNFIKTNDELILECLSKSKRLYNILSMQDTSKFENEEHQPGCIIESVAMQNANLRQLNNLLDEIN